MTKITTFLVIVMLCLSVTTYAQSIELKGLVTDAQTLQPLDDVSINITQNNTHTHTNEHGSFYFANLQQGNYSLRIEKNGYQTQLIEVNTNDTTLIIIPLINTAVKLNEVAIAADRPVSAASSAYISQASFANRPKGSAQDLLRLVPGLFIAQHAGGGKAEQIFIRGFDCDHGTDIATFVDGIPVNMPSHGHGQGYADLHFLIPEVVEGMSIFKGTSSPLYGNFATGAAVSFKTLDTLANNLIQLEAGAVPQANVMSSSRGLAMVQVPLNSSKIKSYFAIDIINNRGFFYRSQNFKRANIFSKTTYQINDNSKLQFSVTGFGSSWNAFGQVPERAVQSGLLSRYGSIDPNEGGTTQRNNYNLNYTAKLGAGEFETQAYVSTYRFKLFSNFTFFLNDSINGDMIEQDDNRTVRGLNTKYSVGHKLFNSYSKFTIGASFRADEIENQLWHAPLRTRLTATAHSLIHERATGVFVNEVINFTSKFRAEIGGRYDYYIFDVEDLLPTDSVHTNYSGFNYQSAINPKLNLIYAVNNNWQLFFNTGSGYHSNDARSSVQDKKQHRLPLAISSELGTLFNINKTVISAAVWGMDLSNELVYVGDDGTTENKGASRRYGVDVSVRSALTSLLYFDADINVSRSRLIDTIFGVQKTTDYYIPLAPTLTSVGGLTAKFKNGFECSVRYRYLKQRPANESNTIVARGYTVADATINYRYKKYKVGVSVENFFNVNWNEAQFATETRLRNETKSVEELHFTPGTPLYAKLTVGYLF